MESEQRILIEVIREMQNKFDDWDLHISNNQQPVPIQDLDYWKEQLKIVALSFKGGEE